ncbi:MAG: putative integral rane transport protein [Microbacteriaceae bacterium]|nr:putative integral rane transport protein [Microbacteriaceae bacterium]
MSTAVANAGIDESPIQLEKAVIKSWKTPIIFSVFTVLGALLFIAFGRSGDTHFNLTTSFDFIKIPILSVPTRQTGIVIPILLLAITAFGYWRSYIAKKVPLWLTAIFAILFFVGFLTWAAAGSTTPVAVPGLLLSAIGISVPLIFGALGGVITERVGVVNVAIEGQLLAGAFVSAVVATVTHSAVAGFIAAMFAGVLVSALLAVFSITYIVDQVIVGVVLNVLVIGLTDFLYSQVLANQPSQFNAPTQFPILPIPLLSQIPLLGPALFRQTVIVYIMYVAVFLVWFGLYKTRWGLRLRAVGEHPTAADTVGIRVNPTRFWNVLLAGAIVGAGGSYFSLAASPLFTREVTQGAGYIALAAVIFGQWNPVRATLAALLFGFTTSLKYTLVTSASPVPSEFMAMLPYVVTIFAVAGLVGHVRGPAASGKPYIKS